jgi:pyruvate/2-oxoglutarate dehydrogenase complex dihydrolipoamide dehydrogenase (E3) component
MQYDAIFIGAGQAGPFIAAKYNDDGKQVALVEGAKIGGTCVNQGCIPTKTLVASARAIYLASRGDEYGFSTGSLEVNFERVMERMNDRRGGAYSRIDGWMRSLENMTIYDGYGKFIGTENGLHQVQVNDDVISAPEVFINTGAHPFVPPINGIQDIDYLINAEVLELSQVPEHLLVLGGGYIGLEFGQAFRRFGAQVTIIEASPQIVIREDADVAESVTEILEAEDITVHTGCKATAVSQDADGTIHLTIESPNGHSEITGSHLLAAVGRRPNSANLGLATVGVEINERGYINTNEQLQTNVTGIWAIGDVNGRGAFTHTSYHDHEIVMDTIAGIERQVSDRNMAYAMYIDPPLGRVGMSEKQARESGKNVLMTIRPMKHVSRAIEQGETFGMIKILVDADTEQFLGATVLGFHGDDVVQVVSYYMATGASYKLMKNALPIHPTISEYFPTLLNELKPLE